MPGERPPLDETLRETVRRTYAQIAVAPEVGLKEVEERGYSIDEPISLHAPRRSANATV